MTPTRIRVIATLPLSNEQPLITEEINLVSFDSGLERRMCQKQSPSEKIQGGFYYHGKITLSNSTQVMGGQLVVPDVRIGIIGKEHGSDSICRDPSLF